MGLIRTKIGSAIDYKLDSENLECVRTTKDLGITVNNDVSWGARIIDLNLQRKQIEHSDISSECQNLEDESIRKHLNITLVRPQLEYSSEL